MALTTRDRARLSLGIQAGIFLAAVIVLAILIDWSAIRGSFFAFENLGPMLPEIITVGLFNTVQYTVVGFIFGLLGGTLLALMRMSSFPAG